MLIILRLAVLPHKHPHELLDSVVKERMVKSFVSTEARILQQPHLPSSDFENFFSISTTCAFDQHLASRQREANSTAFQTAVNRLFLPPPIISTEPLQTQTLPPEEEAHSTQLSLLCNPYFKYNFLFYKKFKELLTPEEVRIIGTKKPRSIDCYAFVSTPANSRAAATQTTSAPPAETKRPIADSAVLLIRPHHSAPQSSRDSISL